MTSHRKWIVLIVVLLIGSSNATAQSTTAPASQPSLDAAFDSVLDQLSKLKGSYDAAVAQDPSLKGAPFQLRVPMPADVVYTPVKQYCIANEGSDQNNGSKAAPFATLNRALQQVTADRNSGAIPPEGSNAIAEISYKGGEKFTQDFTNSGISENYVLFDSYGSGWAEIDSPGIAFQKINNEPDAAGIHLQYLDLVCTNPSTGSGQAPSTGSGQAPSNASGQAPAITYGLSVNQVNDVSCDYCSFSGFTFNVAASFKTDGLRLAYNYSERARGAAGSESGTGFFADQATHVQCYGNFHYHEGWSEADYSPAWWADVSDLTPGHVPSPANQVLMQHLQFFHGEYWRDDVSWEPIDITDSIYVNSASTGLQMRAGGTARRCIFAHNGASNDSFVIGPSGGYEYVALFGEDPFRETFNYWGQGIALKSASGFARHVRAISASTLTQNAVVEVYPPILGEPGNGPVPTPLATTQPIPPTQAVVDDVKGVWPVNNPALFPAPAAVFVDPTLTGTTTVTNVRVRAPRPRERVLTLPAIYGVASDDQLAALFKANFRNWRNDLRFTAQYIWDRADQWIKANP